MGFPESSALDPTKELAYASQRGLETLKLLVCYKTLQSPQIHLYPTQG